MHLESLRLYNFRNLKDQTVFFAPGANFFYGKNGQGKTNFVEAVAFLATGRSFRTSKFAELICHNKKQASVFAKVLADNNSFEIGMAIEDDSRSALIDGKRVDLLTAIMGKLLAVSFSPSDLSLVRGAPQERRRFLDKHMVDFRPVLLSSVVDFHKALKSKNKMLREGVTDLRMYETWNSILAEKSLTIFGARSEFLKQLEDKASAFYNEFSNLDGELKLSLKSNIGSESYQEINQTTVFERIMSAHERDLRNCSSVIGSHRDEVIITLGGEPVRSFASQGQARSVVLSLKLAVVELLEENRADSPVVLLDDVESELDQNRRNLLIDLIFRRERQVFMTGTQAPNDLLHSGTRLNKCWRIESGDIIYEKS